MKANSNTQFESIGTGFICELGRELYLVTACHVVRQIIEERNNPFYVYIPGILGSKNIFKFKRIIKLEEDTSISDALVDECGDTIFIPINEEIISKPDSQYWTRTGGERTSTEKDVQKSDYLKDWLIRHTQKVYHFEINYRGQTKDSIDNAYIGKAVGMACYTILQTSWARSESWVSHILKEAIVSAQVREASKLEESKIREISKAINKPVMPSKLTSCSALLDKKYADVELILVEGDSAGQNVVSARDGRTQAVLPLKGKSLNTEKNTLEKALSNKEVTSILNVIGAGLTVETEGFSIFDINKSKVGKIIIMTDADVDGAHIRTLLLSLLNRFTAPLLEAGIVYISIPPKYKVISTGKYYYSEEEFQQAKANGEVVGAFKRYKGLGEVDAKDLWETSLNPATRRLLQIKVDTSDPEFRNAIRVMSGSDSSIRKQMILEELLVDYDDHDEAMEVLAELYSVMDANQEEEVDYEEIYY